MTTPEKICENAKSLPGSIAFYYEDLVSGKKVSFNENSPIIAASVIKLFVLAEILARINEGDFSKNDEYILRDEDKLPSCGALSYLHSGISLTLEDLYVAMIIHSDNTATNVLIKLLGIDRINARMRSLGCVDSSLNRLLFDSEASSKGIENRVSACDAALLLRLVYKGEFISKECSNEFISILKKQRLNGKIPFFIGRYCPIAHKTGEDRGISHDVGIVLAEKPFILCFLSERTDVPEFERFIQDAARDIYETAK